MELSLYLPFVALVAKMVFGVIWAISPKTAGKAAIKTVMFVMAVLIVAAMLAIPGIVRAEEWQGATVNGSVEVSVDDEPLYLVVYTTDDGYVLSYFDDTELSKGTRIRVVVSPYGETVDAEVEEEPIWFPPFLLFGIVATPVVNKNKKYKFAQTMPPDLYLPCKVWDVQISIVYYTDKGRQFSSVVLEQTTIKALKSDKVADVAKVYSESISKAISLLNRATVKEVPAYVVAYVPSYKQMAVVDCNYVGFLEYWRNTTISDKVSAANALLRKDVQIIPETSEHKPASSELSVTRAPAADIKVISDKDDPVRQLIKVKYSDTSEEYTFRCRKAHTPGDFVCVYTKRKGEEKKTYKNVKVTEYFFLHESEVKALANSFGYSDISEVYCDQAIGDEEAWAYWFEHCFLTEKDADEYEDVYDYYAPSAEEIADFQSMRETMLGAGYRDF